MPARTTSAPFAPIASTPNDGFQTIDTPNGPVDVPAFVAERIRASTKPNGGWSSPMSEAAARDGLQKLGAAVPPHPTGADLDRAGSEYFRGAENGMAIMGPQPPMPLEERRRRLMNEAVQFRLGKGMPRAQAEQEVNRMYNVPPPTQPGAAPTGPIAGIIHGGSPLAAAAPFAPPGAAAPFAPEAAAPFAQQGAAAPLAAAAPIRAAMPTAAESADQELARRLAMARGGGMG